jgi:MarR family transcriptional regulator, transcriptional regulator for hemolysin
MAAFELEKHAFFWMTQVIASRDRRLAEALDGHGLRAPEWRVLATLHARQRCSMSELADLASIERSTLTRIVDRMQQSGWVTRLSDADDMRVTRLAPTASGEKLFARVWPAVEELNREALAGLPDGAADLLRWTLQCMQSNLDAGRNQATKPAARAASHP